MNMVTYTHALIYIHIPIIKVFVGRGYKKYYILPSTYRVYSIIVYLAYEYNISFTVYLITNIIYNNT